MDAPGILIVAATQAELCGQPGLVCGVGPVEAAAHTARALSSTRPRAVLHVGLAGAQRTSGIDVGALVVGSEAVYDDLVTSTPLAPVVAAGDPRLVRAVARVLGVDPVSIGTSGRIGGVTSACPVEAMEGFAVLRACELAMVPAVEVRAVSNRVDDDRADWRLAGALEALEAALPRLLEGVAAELRPGM